MTTQKNSRADQNVAVKMIDQMFGDVEGWQEAVAQSTEAANVAEQVYALRERHGLTQRELADRVGTSQSVIARLEDADYAGHSLTMLKRIGLAVGEGVTVSVTPLGDRGASRPSTSRSRKTDVIGERTFKRKNVLVAKSKASAGARKSKFDEDIAAPRSGHATRVAEASPAAWSLKGSKSGGLQRKSKEKTKRKV